MKKVILAGLIILSCQSLFAQNKVRPNECWVRRSVLDKRPGIITAALSKDLYVAYDGKNCGIYKLWRDGVVYSGTIWDTKHGPQPESIGKSFTQGIVDEQVWFIQKDGKDVATKVQFRGYSWKNNTLVFRYELTADGITVNVEETPEYTLRKKDNLVGLERKFTVANLPDAYSVDLLVSYVNLMMPDDMVTDGVYKKIEKTEHYQNAGTIYDLKGRLKMNAKTPTLLTTYYSPKVIQ